MRTRGDRGFSILEMTVAMGIMLAVTASLFAMLNPAHGAFAVEPEAADMEQRLRVATDTLYKGLAMAGAGGYHAAGSGPLVHHFAPIAPFRRGTTADDPPATFRADTITVTYVPSTTAQTTLSATPSAEDGSVFLSLQPGCPASDPFCGFTRGMTLLMYDEAAHHDLFTVTDTIDGGGLVLHAGRAPFAGYQPLLTRVVEAVNVVWYLKADAPNGLFQLIVRDGVTGADVPVVDNLVGLSFTYYGDPQPPRAIQELSAPTGPWTTYGPKPSVEAVAPYAAGENCVFVDHGTPMPAPRLAELGPAGSLVPLSASMLTDGPWCPDALSEQRWDADLLRIRKVAVVVRVQSANAALRGPAGLLFARGGHSSGGAGWLPDHEVRFEIAPRNLQVAW